MEGSYKRGKGNAGLDGVQFQVSVSTVFLLNALRNHKDWRISTENEDAGKFDDIVIELSDGSAILLQAKHKDSKRISKDQLFSDNTKNADFSLPKYFLSYQEVKSKFNVKNIIICTNADVDKKKLKDILAVKPAGPDSILHYEEGGCSFIKFNENILPDLRVNSESYYEKNVRNKSIGKEAISDGNLREFIEKLQFFTNYPKGDNLHKVIDQLLARLTDSQVWSDTSSREIFGKVEDWFKQGHGEYLTESRANAMFCEIKSDQFCKTLKKHDVSFASTDLGFKEGKRIYHVSVETGYLLQALKMFHALQERKTLFVNPENGSEASKQAVEAFRLPKYEFLILILHKNIKQCLVLEIYVKLKDVLDKYSYKKVVSISDKQNVQQSLLKDDIFEIDVSVKIRNLAQQCQRKLVKKENINFQGKNISLEYLLGASTVEDYDRALDSEELEKLVRGEEIKVGTPVASLDPNIERYYINRRIEREVKKEKNELIPNETRKETFTQDDIFGVKEKFIIISDCAGMGKSTILAKLATNMNQKYPHLWIIWIDLNNYSKILRDSRRRKQRSIKITEFLGSNEATRISSPLESSVFSMDQKVVVMLDSFDEVSPDYTELVLSLLRQCQEGPNFAKVFITTRPHMNRDLENLLNVKPFMLQPFTATDQIEFLASYWGQNLELDENNRDKCEKYAVALINKMSSWVKTKHNLTAIPLQVRMLAEIFQEKSTENTREWESCMEFLEGDKEEPELPEKVKITELYEMFAEMKLNIFLDKINPSGNVAVNDLHESQFERYFVSHQSLALKEILFNEALHVKAIHNLFSHFRYDDTIESNLLKVGILQMSNGKLGFVHRTYGEYFVAKTILEVSELDGNKFSQNVDFQQFFIDDILCNPQFTVIRAFLDSALEDVLDSLPANVFENYRMSITSDPQSQKRRSELLHLLAREGHVSILEMILKCINFKIKKFNNTENELFDYTKETNATFIGKKENTLNLLQGLVEQHGIDIEDELGNTPLHYATDGEHLNMVRYLVEHGANIHCRNHAGESAIHEAARRGHLKAIQFLAKHGGDITTENKGGYTALHLAARDGHLDVCKFLQERGIDVNSNSKEGHSALHLASVRGHSNVVKFLVEYAHVSAQNSGFTALHFAAAKGHLDMCAILIGKGIDVNFYHENSQSALHLASLCGHLDVVKFLVEHAKADVNVGSDANMSALHWAAQNGHLEICKYLVERGKDINPRGFTALHSAAKGGHFEVCKFLIEEGIDVDQRDINGQSALLLASLCGHLGIVKLLVECGQADINIATNDGMTALHGALFVASSWTQEDVVKFLVDANAHIGEEGFTDPHLATQEDLLEVCKFLVEQGIDVNLRDKNGFNALLIASLWGHLGIVKYLVEIGQADINIADNDGFTALHAAVQENHLDVCEFLIERGIDVNLCNSTGTTALHSASSRGQLEIVKLLVEYAHADINLANTTGTTALHWASNEGHVEVCKYLLERGADVNLCRKDGFTVLHVAVLMGQLDITKTLVGAGADVNIRSSDGLTALQAATQNGHLLIAEFLRGTTSD